MNLKESQIIITDLPTYSSSAKFLIVEDFALAQHPTSIHFGRCSLIGKVTFDQDKFYRLKSMQIDSLPK